MSLAKMVACTGAGKLKWGFTLTSYCSSSHNPIDLLNGCHHVRGEFIISSSEVSFNACPKAFQLILLAGLG
jgi:hypothetical protein